jgi:hypothetical protein
MHITLDSLLFFIFFIYLLLGQFVIARFLNELLKSDLIPEYVKSSFDSLTPIATGSIRAELLLLKMIYSGSFSLFSDKKIVAYGRFAQLICYIGVLFAFVCMIRLMLHL